MTSWEWDFHTTYKTDDDWGMDYDVVLPALKHVWPFPDGYTESSGEMGQRLGFSGSWSIDRHSKPHVFDFLNHIDPYEPIVTHSIRFLMVTTPYKVVFAGLYVSRFNTPLSSSMCILYIHEKKQLY